MIKLREIKKDGEKIKCNAFLEDCKLPVQLTYDVKSKAFEKFKFPTGYEYCTSHIHMAKKFFDKVLKAGQGLPINETIMWY